MVYITARTPWGQGETFILEEMLEIKRQEVELLIVPRNPSKSIFHKKAEELLENAIWMPLINFRMVAVFLGALLTNLSVWKVLTSIIKASRNPRILVKNLVVFPKSVFIAKYIQKKDIKQIHAHWGATTATMAYVISEITGIPWSLTLHRGDVKGNNILKKKVESAEFVRCISECTKKMLLRIVGEGYEQKIRIIHMGVEFPTDVSEFRNRKGTFIMITPANLLEVKGHKYLIKACYTLIQQGISDFQCIFYGEGKLRANLENLIKNKGLVNHIRMPGAIPHEELMMIYKNRQVDVVVLPSINTSDGEHEGIPVSLMEAMAYGAPIISTNTGGIPELIGNGSGIMVPEKDEKSIYDSIYELMKNENDLKLFAQRGRKKIAEEFNVQVVVKELISLFSDGE